MLAVSVTAEPVMAKEVPDKVITGTTGALTTMCIVLLLTVSAAPLQSPVPASMQRMLSPLAGV